ncbi:MAG: glycosyltransferase family 4 protein [Nannocystaceae bacterium]|nr:glycosyltransferase family 4 protein [Nannocystaceae bacterium]
MRILYLHQYFVPPDGSGGTRSYELARRLVARGHEVTLVTSNAMMPRPWRERTEIVRTSLDGIELVVLPVRYDNHMDYRTRMAAFARFAVAATTVALEQRADVVFATSTPLTIALPGLAARVGLRAPMVFEVRDLWPELPIAMGALRNPLLRAAASGLEWAAYHGASRIVALSPAIADGVARRGIARERIAVVPNACDLAMFAGAQAQAPAARERHLHAFDPARPLVLYAGTFGAINGVPWLADVAAAAAQHGSDLQFALLGDGADRAALCERAAAHGVLERSLRVLPPVPKREMPGVLGCATVATSLFLPLPEMEANSANKFFDALAAGRPLAINYGGWHADLLRDSGAGIAMPHKHPAAAARMLHALAHDPSQLARARAASAQLARAQFDRDTLANTLESVLLDAVREAHGPRRRGRAAVRDRRGTDPRSASA